MKQYRNRIDSGIIATQVNEGGKLYSYTIEGNTFACLPHLEPKEWDIILPEQPAKDWVIESFINHTILGDYKYIRQTTGLYKCLSNNDIPDQQFDKFKPETIGITSIRIFSTDTVYTVSDKIVHSYPYVSVYDIYGFGIIDGNIRFYIDDNGCYFETFKDIKHYTEPAKVLLTTHDGVDVTDTQTIVFALDKITYNTWDIKCSSAINAANWIKKEHLYFSTEQSRQDYISRNEKWYSVADVTKWIEDNGQDYHEWGGSPIHPKNYIYLPKSSLNKLI